jgi:hypothetical protein
LACADFTFKLLYKIVCLRDKNDLINPEFCSALLNSVAQALENLSPEKGAEIWTMLLHLFNKVNYMVVDVAEPIPLTAQHVGKVRELVTYFAENKGSVRGKYKNLLFLESVP